jgi:outer membrane biosynthesis protein TonB
MRTGFTVSIIGHALVLGLGLVALGTKPLESEKIEALPVELVSVDEETDLLKGDESSKILPEEKPQPLPQVEAEVPAPEPAEKPAEKVVEATPVPAPPPPPPPPPLEPVTPPEPETQIASIPEPTPEPEPAPAVVPEPAPVPVNPNVPRPRPDPPKQVTQPKPAPEVARSETPEQQFNADEISALLNKQEPTGGGAPEPSPEPQTLGSIDGRAEAAMTQSEIAALKARLYQCWNPPVAVREAANLVVTVRINLLIDGSLSGAPQVVGGGLDPLTQIAAESAIRAVVQCAPFGDILRPEKYALWSEIEFVFDPREMLGG